MTLTPSHIMQYLYCPRFTYYEYVLCVPQNEEKNYKVMRGRMLHDEKLAINKPYLRQRIGAIAKYMDQYLTNNLLRGRLDEVLELNDGSMAPLDYKFAEWDDTVYNTYKTQLYCYAWLIEENFNREVNKGFLVYTRSKNKLIEVPIYPEDKEQVKKAAKAVYTIISGNIYPRATSVKARCAHCTYRNLCPQ